MSMSKKDFIALADRIRDLQRTNAWREMDSESQFVIIQHLTWFCQDQNPQFNKERWLSYIAGGVWAVRRCNQVVTLL